MSHYSLPPFVAKYFWGDNLSDFDIDKHQQYIIQTILERGDQKSIHWLFSRFHKDTIVQIFPDIKLSKKSENFWYIYLS